MNDDGKGGRMARLAILCTHPIQYYSPWFRFIAGEGRVEAKVFYLWDFGVREHRDRKFGEAIIWDVDLLDGYGHEFVPNVSSRPGTHHIGGLYNPSLISRLRAFAPDAVLCMGYNYRTFYDLLWRWPFRDVPLLLRGDSHRLARRWDPVAIPRRRWIGYWFRRFSAFLYVGEANRRYFLYHGVPEEKLFRAPHAVDNARFMSRPAETAKAAAAWRAELGIPESATLVLFAGKFEPKKRPLDLLRAFRKADVEGTALLFAGGGAMNDALVREARGDGRIFFGPFQNQSQMPRAYAACDLFALTSFPFETWGLSINEAMCLGKPVIVSDHVGCQMDLVHPGVNGWVYPAADVSALERCLREALGDKARLTRMGEEGRRIIEGYSYRTATDGLYAALRGVGVLEPENSHPGCRGRLGSLPSAPGGI